EEAAKDSSLRVRLQARSALMSYRISGYRSEPKVTEMPAAKTTAVAPTRTGFWPFSSIKSAVSSQPVTPARAVTTETAPPPLAQIRARSLAIPSQNPRLVSNPIEESP